MKLGIVADEISRDFTEAVRIGTSLGLRRYEVRFLKSGRAPMCDSAEMAELETHGVEITALSPGLFKMTETAEAFAHEMAEVYPRAAAWAHRWNLPGLIVFGFHKPGATEENAAKLPAQPVPSHVEDWFSAASERAAADGLLLMIEPEPICWIDTSRAAASLIERTGASSLRINYDPGNVAWFEGRDPIGEFAAAAPWIANVHIKDLIPKAGRPDFVAAGEGIIDFRAHFAALRGIGYTGPISLEPHMDGRAETIQRCKEAVERSYETNSSASD